jgi:hypothetical protein
MFSPVEGDELHGFIIYNMIPLKLAEAVEAILKYWGVHFSW